MAETHSAVQIAAEVAAGSRRAADVCDEAFARIEAVDPQVKAFLRPCVDEARKQAARIDADIAGGMPVGPLAGVPIAIKDNMCTTFAPTTCGSRILEGHDSPFNATVVEKLRAAGAVVVGKTNMDEFAMGSSTEGSAYFATRNPWNLDYVPGGSSGGSAAAVASGMVPVALGSDTGGSIRQPAAFCGTVGLKPTYGRVSRYGLVAYGSSLDQIGPLAREASDAALVLSVIAGHDGHDSTSANEPVPDYVAELQDAPVDTLAGRLRIGVPEEYFGEGLDPETRAAVQAAIKKFKSQGATIVEVSLPRMPYAIAAYYLVATAECSSNLARYDGVHYGHRTAQPENIIDLYSSSRSEGFGEEVKRRIMLGTFALSAGYYDQYYNKALKVRRLIKDDFDRAFEQCDLLIGPAAPTPAFRLGEKLDDPLAMYLADVYTVSLNLAGLPGLTVPCGLTEGGLPIGMQLMGPVFRESTLLQAARLYERQTDWHTGRPPVAAG